MRFGCVIFLTILLPSRADAQDSALNFSNIPDHYYRKIEKKAAKQEVRLTKQTQKALKSVEKQEAQLYNALHKLDSFKAKELMGYGRVAYDKLQQKIADKATKLIIPVSGPYDATLDTMSGVLGFLKGKVPKAEGKIKDALSNVESLDGMSNQA
ncbi:MAG: hypothetical protein V4722_06655 [Bacteroidota bacterium]